MINLRNMNLKVYSQNLVRLKLFTKLLCVLFILSITVPAAQAANKIQITFSQGSYVDCDPNSPDRSFTGDFEDCINPKKNTDLQDNGCDESQLNVKFFGARNETVGLGSVRYKTFRYYGIDEGAEEFLGNSRIWYSIDCIYTGNISLISSNFYKIFIGGNYLGEISKADLIKRKWKLNLKY